MKRTLLSTLIGVMVAGVAGVASAQKISDDVVKIGVLTDLSGAYSDVAGQGAVIAATEASSELWAILKRPDEKWVTERAYENPKFVEDLVRDVAMRLKQDERILSLVVEAENFESIHNHSAFARISLP